MDKYKEASVLAVKLLKDGVASNPEEAWIQATKQVFPSSAELQKKGCPRGAFLGLCNAGMIEGIPAGIPSKQTKNGEYAVAAVKALKANRFLSSQPDLLWKKVAGSTKSENGQMDVVFGLWDANYIHA